MLDAIKQILIKELGYSDHSASITAKDLLSLDQSLQNALNDWVEDRTEVEFGVEGFTTNWLITEKGMTYPAALIALDWLIKEPEVAKNELAKDYIR
jgi:hypothetical protein